MNNKKRIHIANEESREIGARIKYLRTNLGLSQTELGKRSDLSNNHICSIEHGIENVSNDAVARLAATLGVTYRYLKNGDMKSLDTRRPRKAKEDTTIPGQLTFADLGIC